MNISELIWQNKIDNRFSCSVKKLTDKIGEIIILDEQKRIILLKQEINLSQADGVSQKDLKQWQSIIKECINNQ